MTFPGQFPSCVCPVGYHVSHKRRMSAAEADWLTNNRQSESRASPLSISLL